MYIYRGHRNIMTKKSHMWERPGAGGRVRHETNCLRGQLACTAHVSSQTTLRKPSVAPHDGTVCVETYQIIWGGNMHILYCKTYLFFNRLGIFFYYF